DRFHLMANVIERVPGLSARAQEAKQFIQNRMAEHHEYIREHGQDMPEIRNWRWSAALKD
ncbi:MAG: hypothetical protein U1E13_13750, partial [Methylophilaceae bacterium]|nr:hypothetical protein [Methylophilaceae bacterium]